MKTIILVMSAIFVLVGGVYLALAVYVGNTATRDTKIKSDVILVLGAHAYDGSSYNPCLVSRVAHAATLYKAKYAPKLLVSGGIDKRRSSVSEAEVMKRIAVSLGVPADDILLESASQSTYENLLFSNPIMQANHFNTAILVTEPFHAYRAAMVARKLGFNFTSSPAVDSVCWLPRKYSSLYFLREPLAVMVYKLQGKL